MRTLSIKKGNKTIISKPFDFEALCLINDSININGDKMGVLRMTGDALEYLFEGTEVTDDMIKNMDNADRAVMCTTLWGWYISDMSGKKEKNE